MRRLQHHLSDRVGCCGNGPQAEVGLYWHFLFRVGALPFPRLRLLTGRAAWAAASYRRCCCCRKPFRSSTACLAWNPSHPPNGPAATSWHHPESGHTTAPSTAMRPWRAHCCVSCRSTGYSPPKLVLPACPNRVPVVARAARTLLPSLAAL